MKTTHFKNFIRSPYAWPGGYPLFAVMSDGGCLCNKCCKENARLIIRDTRNYVPRSMGSGWECTAIDVNYEDTKLYCDNCGDKIEPAYGEGE